MFASKNLSPIQEGIDGFLQLKLAGKIWEASGVLQTDKDTEAGLPDLGRLPIAHYPLPTISALN